MLVLGTGERAWRQEHAPCPRSSKNPESGEAEVEGERDGQQEMPFENMARSRRRARVRLEGLVNHFKVTLVFCCCFLFCFGLVFCFTAYLVGS